MEPPDALRAFRRSFYEYLHRRGDALFELADAILAADGAAPSPAHRRGWGSPYAALSRGWIDEEPLRDLLARHPLGDGGQDDPPVYAVDMSVWDRCDTEASPERGFYYHPSRHSAGQPIVAGWAYQWIAQIGFARESWFSKGWPGNLAAQRSSCGCGWGAASTPIRASLGRPRRHGPKMDTKDPSTWPEPTAEHACEDPGYGAVRVRAWAGLHPKVQAHEGRGPRPIVVGTLVLVEVGRLPRQTREPRALWLWWHSPGGVAPDLRLIWRAYVRRFDLEHTFRFLKQTLGWTTPRVRCPEQADLRLPWERSYDPGRLTPVRVRRAVSALLPELGTPAKPPKPCGRSPGRPKGRLSSRAKRYPALKKIA